MPQFLDRECRCPNEPYAQFDSVIRRELRLPLFADDIVNNSTFCTMIQKNVVQTLDALSLRDLLRRLGNKVGVYHIWQYEDFCDVHQRQNLYCVYVGKGAALTRLLDHMSENSLEQEDGPLDSEAMKALERRRATDRRKKREKFRADEPYWISFFECENRIAKYVEQLFLDVYHFPINTNENPGQEQLWASWSEDRYSIGTEAYAVANLPNAPTGF